MTGCLRMPHHEQHNHQPEQRDDAAQGRDALPSTDEHAGAWAGDARRGRAVAPAWTLPGPPPPQTAWRCPRRARRRVALHSPFHRAPR